MRKFFKRHIGQILLDAGFLSRQVLASALNEQRQTKELLGQVLVRMGVLKAPDMKASLLVQEYLSNIEAAVKTAAGERQRLGALLVESGRISDADLDKAIAEQEKSGEKLGEVFVRLGLVSDQQLDALLNFQVNQATPSSNPFRLGELLVTTGNLSRKQLKAALTKQSLSHKKLGEVLVEEGYVQPSQVDYGIGLQKMLMNAVLAAIFSFGVNATSYASDVLLEWDPSPDATVVGYKVYYQADSPVQPFQGSGSVEGAAPVDVQSQASATITGLDPTHTYYFAVTAYDSSGVESVYSNVITIEPLNPTTSITYPVNNATVSGTQTVSADSSNNPTIAGMQFFVNGALQDTDNSAPYEYAWDTSGLTPGNYTLVAKAFDGTGKVTESGAVSVTVAATDVTPPSVSLTSPAQSATVSGTTVISATANDDFGVSRVEFYEGDNLLFAGNAAPFSFNWNTTLVANGSHALVAKAYDLAGNVAQASNILVSVNNVVPDTAVPTVSSFSMPETADSLAVMIASFAASDNVKVTGFLVTESASAPSAGASGWGQFAPSSFAFSAAGSRTAYAWTKDAAGNVSAPLSSSVTITLPQTPTDTTTETLTIADAVLALNIAVGKVSPSEEQKSRLDVAPVIAGKSVANGVVNTGDVIVILSKVVGKAPAKL